MAGELPPGTIHHVSGEVLDDDGTILARTKRSIKAADHLSDLDAGVVAVLLKLAADCDTILASGGINKAGKFDNVTVPTYLRYAESLGLTPAARSGLKDGGAAPTKVSKISQMRDRHQERKAG